MQNKSFTEQKNRLLKCVKSTIRAQNSLNWENGVNIFKAGFVLAINKLFLETFTWLQEVGEGEVDDPLLEKNIKHFEALVFFDERPDYNVFFVPTTLMYAVVKLVEKTGAEAAVKKEQIVAVLREFGWDETVLPLEYAEKEFCLE